MVAIKYDFNSCYEYNDPQYNYEQFYSDYEPSAFYESCRDILRVILAECDLETPQPTFVRFPDPVKLLIICKQKASKFY